MFYRNQPGSSTPKKQNRKRAIDETDSDEDASQADTSEKEPPLKKEKAKIKEITKKHEKKNQENHKKEEVSSPKAAVTSPSSNVNISSTTTQKSSPVSTAAIAPIPKIIIPPEIVSAADDGSSSSSSEDQPIAIKEKRKAEVLSKESGKIGITIKKTSTTSSTKPLLSPKIKIEKKLPPVSTKDEEQDSLSTTTETSSCSIGVEGKKDLPKTMIPDNIITVKTEKTPEKSVPVPDSKTCSKENKFTNLMTNSNLKLLTSPKSAHPKLWLPSQSTSDQVFITDVTVNLETVTIRECKTERGFFKTRQDMERNYTKAQ